VIFMQLNSTHLADAEWNEGVMRIQFRSGDVYDYYDVPNGTFQELVSSPSPGAYFRQNVKGTYEFTRVG
jgi:hypothetical protein